MRCISVHDATAAVGCQDPSPGDLHTSDVASVLILDLGITGASVRRELRLEAGMACLHLSGERLAGGGQGWLGAWRVLHRANYSRLVGSQLSGTCQAHGLGQSIHVIHLTLVVVLCLDDVAQASVHQAGRGEDQDDRAGWVGDLRAAADWSAYGGGGPRGPAHCVLQHRPPQCHTGHHSRTRAESPGQVDLCHIRFDRLIVQFSFYWLF